MIYVCADDYGMTDVTCTRIEACAKKGKLNKVSVLPNTEIEDIGSRIRHMGTSVGIHINLIEGKALSERKKVSILTDENGYFTHSFFGLLLISLSPKRGKLKEQVYTEIKSQIKRCRTEIIPKGGICIDSHQHTHMIPCIFKTLLRVLHDEGLKAEYIRISAEPILPYLLTPSLYITYNPINLAKQWLLKFLNIFNRKGLKKSGIKTALFFGVLFSGRMDGSRINKILPKYIRLAERKNRDIEMYFHPGYTKQGERIFDENKKSFHRFYISDNRRLEYDTLMNLNVLENTAKDEGKCNILNMNV